MDNINSKYARKLLTFPAITDVTTYWTGKWDKCIGKLEEKYYVVTFISNGQHTPLRTLRFTKTIYKEIMKERNQWIKNRILNRSELAGRIWNKNLDQNKLRRRLEEKADWGTFTDSEKKKIVREVEDLLFEIKQSFQ